MIRSWRNAATRKVWEGEQPNQFRGLDLEAACAQYGDDVAGLEPPLRSVGLHKLKGARKSQWAMTVNARWRICFEFHTGDAYDVEIVDYHRG